MSPESIALIVTTLASLAGVAKAIAEARKARYEKEKAELETARAELEAARADKAEKTTHAVIEGVEKVKKTLVESNLAQYLQDEIQSVATERGVEGDLNKMVKNVRKTTALDRTKLLEKLSDENECAK